MKQNQYTMRIIYKFCFTSLTHVQDLIDNKPIHIATVNTDNNPNLSVASDVRVLDDNKIILTIYYLIMKYLEKL